MILEGIVTTLGEGGQTNIAPMGPLVEPDLQRFVLRPYKTSTTYRNLVAHPQGVFHIMDDVLMMARAAIGRLDPAPEMVPANVVRGQVLKAACRWYEFEIEKLDDSQDRTQIDVRVVHTGKFREFIGFNRAKHAVIEAAILATRVHLLPQQQILDEFERLRSPVQKTAGPNEILAFDLLLNYVGEQYSASQEGA